MPLADVLVLLVSRECYLVSLNDFTMGVVKKYLLRKRQTLKNYLSFNFCPLNLVDTVAFPAERPRNFRFEPLWDYWNYMRTAPKKRAKWVSGWREAVFLIWLFILIELNEVLDDFLKRQTTRTLLVNTVVEKWNSKKTVARRLYDSKNFTLYI